MSRPVTCPKCDAPDWIGEQIVTAPTDFWAPAWHRRTWCKHCGWAVEEIRGGGLIALTSRDQPIDWRGSNPFDADGDEG